MSLSQELSRRVLSGVELQQLFDDIEAKINTTKFVENDMEPAGVRFRHIKNQVLPALSRIVEMPHSVSAASWSLGGHTWFRVNDSELKFYDTIAAMDNRHKSGMPTFQVQAEINVANLDPTPDVTTNTCENKGHLYCLGYSFDGGANWTLKLETSRPCVQSKGEHKSFFKTNNQRHYWLGSTGWYPPSARLGAPIKLIGSFGGGTQQVFTGPAADLGSGIWVSVFTTNDPAASDDNYSLLRCRMEGNMRWTED